MKTLIADCGGSSIKIGYGATSESEVLEHCRLDKNPLIIPNYIAKHRSTSGAPGSVFIGDELENDCECFASLLFRRPIEKGYIVDCETQSIIMDHILKNHFPTLQTNETRLFLPHQPFTPKTLQRDICQLVFEYYGFKEYSSISSQYLSFFGYLNEIRDEKTPLNSQTSNNSIVQSKSALVIDSGFSFSHIYPIVNSLPVKQAIKRIDIGGKLLTNYFKEVVSGRHYDMMDETYLMNIVKERLCLVSNNFEEDLNLCSYIDSPFLVDYVLPDYKNSKTGYVLKTDRPSNEDLQILTLNQERMAIPEILFRPSDIGINQAGVSETAARTILTEFKSSVEQSILFDTILLTGGSTKFKNFKSRLQNDLRGFAPQEFKSVTVHESKNPMTLCWRGASAFSFYEKQLLDNSTVKKEEYDETGFEICLDRFTSS
ncbi:actin-related protein ARP6 [Naegleria gruberi]|uniref:Actin-related protein ARP6 n=1 Tax=Naegleria gruberi TaxID=5762 RepID=D2VT74_NAEGR|nr:actin-related protein ARP6 [Naegleria gruberi]EFC40097.1 actin-related protein ARP6 [Naegleria gruberi]|eukprot:XP_002672841.1 actin-related protein ARP6 [Naegleria gruberi strain NEG-M]